MCGIFGFLGGYAPGNLDSMATALAHRGPDDRGKHVDPDAGLGLGQARLSIIDLSPAGRQPMLDSSGRYVIVYNGEIYNYRELRDELVALGVQFRGHSDTEVVIEWYARTGPAILARLNGVFALAIWDKQARSLFLARDGLGVKTMYITESSQVFAFASEFKALQPVLKQKTLDHV